MTMLQTIKFQNDIFDPVILLFGIQWYVRL